MVCGHIDVLNCHHDYRQGLSFKSFAQLISMITYCCHDGSLRGALLLSVSDVTKPCMRARRGRRSWEARLT